MSEDFDPDKVGSILWTTEDGKTWTTDDHSAEEGKTIETVHVADYDNLQVLYEKTKLAFQRSIVNRKVDQRFDNECEEYDYWMKQEPSNG